MKHNVEWIVCNMCGAYIYPPSEVSDVGVENYEEVFDAPPLEPVYVDLAEINRVRRDAGLSEFASVDGWVSYYRDWAVKFRDEVKALVQARVGELSGKVRDLVFVEDANAFKVRGKRWLAVFVETGTGWVLRCPLCDAVLVEWRLG